METFRLISILRDALVCIGTLVGLAGAIMLFTRKKTLPAVLSLVGFLLVGLEPILDLVIYQWLSYQDGSSWENLSNSYYCISGVSTFLGILLLALAFFLGFREAKPPPSLPPEFPPSS